MTEPDQVEGVPAVRVRALNPQSRSYAVDDEGQFVLYWMTGYRRCRFNFSLQYAVERANRLGKPLVVLEALRSSYRWASDRLHRFVIEGMLDNQANIGATKAHYYGYLERRHGEGSGLLETLADEACLVVSDDFPTFFLPRMLTAAARKVDRPLVVVDSNGLFPMHGTSKVFSRAYDFRRFLQRELPPHLSELPSPEPLSELEKAPSEYCRETLDSIARKWPRLEPELSLDELVASLPIDHGVGVADMKGGPVAAAANLERFLEKRIDRYRDARMDLDQRATTELSPYLHFGHISSAEIFTRLAEREGWTPLRISNSTSGKREGWWGASPDAEAVLDQLVTWREIGFNMAAHQENWTELESLPNWAKKTIQEHANDLRPYVYELQELENAATHDPIWNAAQRELVQDGRMHNYLRMLWGKKIYEWSPDAETALATMIELNNKYAVDGRDPNSYSGIFWCLGRYDRAWGPERPIFGKLRYMTSESTKRKMRLEGYLKRYGEQASLFA